MKIFVDCDAIPRPLRDVLLRVAEREKLEVYFVAARAPAFPQSEFVKTISAGNAFNGADDWIADHVAPGDLAITADIPLADRVIDRGAEALNLKGEFFTQANIKNALAMRDLLDELRVGGEITGGPAPFSDRQRIRFTDALNRFLQKKGK